MTQKAIHVRHNVSGKIKRVQREGRETIILPSYAAKANTVLNDIFYPKEELEASYAGLNRTPAPYGHPLINGKFVPAKDPEAMARSSIFAWNENARWDGERIALDVVIDEARAQESENGRKVLNAIANEEPIATSTGLLCDLETASNKPYKSVARQIEWDHCAILLDETPAISPEQGVGIFVNSASEDAEKIEVINSSLEEGIDREIDYLGTELVRTIGRKRDASVWERIKSAIMEAVTGQDGRETSANKGDADMADEKQLEELSAKVNALTEANEKIGETIANAVSEAVKPLIDAQAEMKANQDAKDEAEKADLVNTIVKANLLEEADAKDLTLNAARALAKKATPGKAAPLNGAFAGNTTDDEWAGYDLNAVVNDRKEAH